MKKLIGLSLFLLLIILGAYYLEKKNISAKITSYEDCVDAGFPIMESYPQKCTTDDRRIFTRDIGNELEMKDLILVDIPRPGAVLESPLRVKGAARGNWFFEGKSVMKLLNDEGKEIGLGRLKALGEWMTEEFVDFSGEFTFDPGTSKKGTLVLENANPSGLEENKKELLIPVRFK